MNMHVAALSLIPKSNFVFAREFCHIVMCTSQYRVSLQTVVSSL